MMSLEPQAQRNLSHALRDQFETAYSAQMLSAGPAAEPLRLFVWYHLSVSDPKPETLNHFSRVPQLGHQRKNITAGSSMTPTPWWRMLCAKHNTWAYTERGLGLAADDYGVKTPGALELGVSGFGAG